MSSDGTWVPKSPDLSALLPADLDPTQNHLPEASSAFHFQAQVPPKLHIDTPPALTRLCYGPNATTNNNILSSSSSSPSLSQTVQFTSAPSPVRTAYIPPTTPRPHHHHHQHFQPQPQPVGGQAHAHAHALPQSPSGLAFAASATPTTPYRETYKPPAALYHKRPSTADPGQHPLSPYTRQKSQLPRPAPVATPAPRRNPTQPALHLHDGRPVASSPSSNTLTPTAAMPPRKPQTDQASPAIEPSPVKTKFPTARIKRIMQADEEVGKVAQQTPIAVGKALEMFMIALVQESAAIAKEKCQKRVSAQMLREVVEADDRWDFLLDIVTKVESEDRSGRGKAKAESDSDEDSEPKKKKGGRRKRSSADD